MPSVLPLCTHQYGEALQEFKGSKVGRKTKHNVVHVLIGGLIT
jgi:hypothetical protein